MSAPEAARKLRVHVETVKRWAKETLSGAESRLPEGSVRRDFVGRYWLQEAAVSRIESVEDYI